MSAGATLPSGKATDDKTFRKQEQKRDRKSLFLNKFIPLQGSSRL